MSQNPYVMNQIAQGFDFNPGGAFFKGQQDRMSMIAMQHQQQVAQMQMAQAQAAVEQQEAMRAAQGAFAADTLGDPRLAPLVDSNTFNRSRFPAASDEPSSVREHAYFLSLSPEGQEQYLTMKRASQFATVGGVPHQFAPGAQGVPLSTLQQEANAAGTIAGAAAGAAAGASGRAQAQVAEEVDAPQRRAKAKQTIVGIDNTLANISEAMGMANFWTTGFVGSQLSNIAGTPAADFKGIVQSIQASLGFSTLQQMRDSSPTGGALGSISERELTLLTAAIKSLEQAQSTGQIVRNLQAIQTHYSNWRETVMGDMGEEGPGDAPATVTEDPLGLRTKNP